MTASQKAQLDMYRDILCQLTEGSTVIFNSIECQVKTGTDHNGDNYIEAGHLCKPSDWGTSEAPYWRRVARLNTTTGEVKAYNADNGIKWRG